MATTTTLLQYPLHNQQHPLELRDFRNDLNPPLCHLCDWKISADGYACLECKFYAHRACAEATPRIDPHPLHTDHPLTLIHRLPPFINNVCDLCGCSHDSLFRCNECDFDLDIRCALSTLSDRGGSQGKTPEQIKLPLHIHTLTSFSTRHDFIGDSNCVICKASVEGDGYTCLHWECEFLVHKRCVQDLFGDEYDFNLDISCATASLLERGGSEGKTPKWIALPLHQHLLTLFSTRYDFVKAIDCVICNASVKGDGDGYACLHWRCEFLVHKGCVQDLFGDEYDFGVDINCATSSLLERGGSEGKTPKWIALPLHHHLLTLFSTRYDFVNATDCVICTARVKGDGDGYACLHWQCEFLIHKRCVQDLYYTDGTKAPHVYHRHPLETFLGEDTGSRRCTKCGSDESSGEFIGCAECQVFYCMDCVQVHEIIPYPRHPDHNLVLLINFPDNDKRQCDSCSVLLKGELCYVCTSCEFFAHVGCALQILSYCEEGMNTEIKLSWHEHPLLLCHKNKYDSDYCSYCEDISTGPMYVCKEEDCKILLHKRCIEIESTIIHPHHPDHSLTLCNEGNFPSCEACSETIWHLYFSCRLCAFYLHAKCSAHVPTRKHYLHEHELLHLEKALCYECIRCGASTNASLFRCVPCNFNLHEKCMELPQVVKHDTHVHPLTLQEAYVEDDSGEYYCDLCAKRRDERLGVYVCGQCTVRWAFHIECILPTLRKVFARKGQSSIIKTLDKKIASIDKEVHKTEEKLKGMKRELDELMKQLTQIISRVEKNYVAMTGEGEPGNPF